MGTPRIIKTGASLLSGQGIQVATQLLLPPLFLHNYGTRGYGEWIVLAAAANYLGTLNFGLHNFANNHVTIAYNRGDMDEVNVIQATAFALVLGLATVASLLAGVLFFLPISSWLHLSISSSEAKATMYLLGLQILVRLVFGFLQTAFLVIGAYHRGSNWLNVLQILTLAGTGTLIFVHAPFVWIAASQVITTAIFSVLVGVDLYIKAPVAFPRLKYVARGRVMDILKPSGYYGMLFSASFLVYQLPVVIMQRMLGPTAVVVFSITRTIYSMSRQALASISTAIGPEITELYGKGNWNGLFKLYDLSERAVFALVPVVTLSTFLATPALLIIWLHKPELFQLDVCILMTLISAAAGIKEHKYQFQISINHHSEMARFLFFTYIGMIAGMVPLVHWLGIRGFLGIWLVTEAIQILYTVKLNQNLFKHFSALEIQPLIKLVTILAFGMLAAWQVAVHVDNRGIILQVAATALFGLLLLAAEFPVFGLGSVTQTLIARFRPSAGQRQGKSEQLTPAA
jgi:O-antigen/teichoic acid export membrane protein